MSKQSYQLSAYQMHMLTAVEYDTTNNSYAEKVEHKPCKSLSLNKIRSK